MTKQLKEFEIPFGAKDSELCGWEYTIPEGMEATIVDNRIIVRKAESEDEKIRKEIVRFIQMEAEGEIVGNKWIAWLEKQGEHANFLKKIQIGDKVTRNKDGMLVNLSQLNRVAKEDEKQGEQKSQRIVSAEAKEAMYDKPAWGEEDEKLYNDLSDTYFYNDEDFPEETYKQMLKRVLDWMNKRAKSLRPQNQQESIEDRANNFFDALGDCGYMQDEILRFKSLWKQAGLLQSQNTWKPSDKQIEILDMVLTNESMDDNIARILRELREQLKKLKA